MAMAATPDLCAACQSLSVEHKPKQGIIACLGCKKHFCGSHMMHHRQQLTDFIQNTVVNERNGLQEKISMLGTEYLPNNISGYRETINTWEAENIEHIKRLAAHVRQQLEEMITKECNNVKQQLTTLSDELNELCESGNYFEDNIEQLRSKFKRMGESIEDLPIELKIKPMPNDLIAVQTTVKLSDGVTYPALVRFADELLQTRKPKRILNLSHVKPGRIASMNNEMIVFCSKQQLPTLNMKTSAWQSLHSLKNIIQMRWLAHVDLFLAVESTASRTRLYHFDPYAITCEEIFGDEKSKLRSYSCLNTSCLP